MTKQMDTPEDDSHGILSLWTAPAEVLFKPRSDSQHRANAIVERCSAKHLSDCTSGGCQQLTNARSVIKLCLIQRTVSSPSIFLQTPPDFSGLSEQHFLGQLQGAYSAAVTKFFNRIRRTSAAHQYLQKVRIVQNEEDIGLSGTCNKPAVFDARFYILRSFVVMKANGVAAGHLLSSDHCMASISTSSCPLLHWLHQ